MKMMMPCTHYITHSILLFYRDASVPYSRTYRRDSQGTLCIRCLRDVPICKFM